MNYYGYKKCGTCRKAEKWLTDHGYTYKEYDITQNPPSVEELTAIIEKSGEPIKKFFNTSGKVYREEKIKDQLPNLSEKQQVELLASNGLLIKRPIVVCEEQATVGFKEEKFESVWG